MRGVRMAAAIPLPMPQLMQSWEDASSHCAIQARTAAGPSVFGEKVPSMPGCGLQAAVKFGPGTRTEGETRNAVGHVTNMHSTPSRDMTQSMSVDAAKPALSVGYSATATPSEAARERIQQHVGASREGALRGQQAYELLTACAQVFSPGARPMRFDRGSDGGCLYVERPKRRMQGVSEDKWRNSGGQKGSSDLRHGPLPLVRRRYGTLSRESDGTRERYHEYTLLRVMTEAEQQAHRIDHPTQNPADGRRDSPRDATPFAATGYPGQSPRLNSDPYSQAVPMMVEDRSVTLFHVLPKPTSAARTSPKGAAGFSPVRSPSPGSPTVRGINAKRKMEFADRMGNQGVAPTQTGMIAEVEQMEDGAQMMLNFLASMGGDVEPELCQTTATAKAERSPEPEPSTAAGSATDSNKTQSASLVTPAHASMSILQAAPTTMSNPPTVGLNMSVDNNGVTNSFELRRVGEHFTQLAAHHMQQGSSMNHLQQCSNGIQSAMSSSSVPLLTSAGSALHPWSMMQMVAPSGEAMKGIAKVKPKAKAAKTKTKAKATVKAKTKTKSVAAASKRKAKGQERAQTYAHPALNAMQHTIATPGAMLQTPLLGGLSSQMRVAMCSTTPLQAWGTPMNAFAHGTPAFFRPQAPPSAAVHQQQVQLQLRANASSASSGSANTTSKKRRQPGMYSSSATPAAAAAAASAAAAVQAYKRFLASHLQASGAK